MELTHIKYAKDYRRVSSIVEETCSEYIGAYATYVGPAAIPNVYGNVDSIVEIATDEGDTAVLYLSIEPEIDQIADVVKYAIHNCINALNAVERDGISSDSAIEVNTTVERANVTTCVNIFERPFDSFTLATDFIDTDIMDLESTLDRAIKIGNAID